jgi:hypothetical protein
MILIENKGNDDDAGQFNVFDHALCWIHAERVINRLIPLNDDHVKAGQFKKLILLLLSVLLNQAKKSLPMCVQ